MSACTPSDRIMQTLRTHVPGATDPMLELELFNIMDEFFRRTMAWKHSDSVVLDQDTNEYNYGVPAGSQLVRMVGVTHNGVPVPYAGQGGSVSTGTGRLDPALTFADGDAAFAPDQLGSLPESPTIFSWAVYRPDVITINVPQADLEEYPAIMWMALTVAKDCLECDSCGDWATPEWVWDMYFQDFLDGTLAKLYGMPSKPWSSEKHALIHHRKYRNLMAFRKQESARGFIYGAPGPWRFPGTWK